MKRCLSIHILLILLACLPSRTLAQAQDPFAVQFEAQMLGWLAAYHVPGAVAAYIRDGAIAWTRAYGIADLRTGAAMQPDMIMNYGSCGKVLTAWGVMRLVEAGMVELDAPANRYLKRWQVTSSQYDPDQVTVRRLLSHTSGLTVHGFSDYSQGRTLPSLMQMLEGQNQMDGRVYIQWEPGTLFQYSGGGFVLLQLIIEDVTGESFASFMQREISAPLGLGSLQWAWTPRLELSAATPHGSQGEPVGYRQLASQAIGSELSTTEDFARFVAAAVQGPNGEPAGRGVLSPQSIQEMVTAQPNTGSTAGLAYGLGALGTDQVVMHFGSNLGWNAFFILDLDLREGLVLATNSANGFPLLTAVQDLWAQTVLGERVNVIPPATDFLGLQGRIGLLLAGLLGAAWLLGLLGFVRRLRTSPKRAAGFHPLRFLWIFPWTLLALFWGYWFYSPDRRLLPTTYPDTWPLPQAAYVWIVLLAWVALSAAMAIAPCRNRIRSFDKNKSAEEAKIFPNGPGG